VTIRTATSTVRFAHPVRLAGIDDVLPPGEYEIITDEEQIGGLNILGWRRLSTTITIHRNGVTQSFAIAPAELEANLVRDAGGTGFPEGT
jgi:hypothetical protein